MSQDSLCKLQNFGWSVLRPTVTLVKLACVSFHFFSFFSCGSFHFSCFFQHKKKNQKQIQKKKRKANINSKKTTKKTQKSNKEKKKCGFQGVPLSRRLQSNFFYIRLQDIVQQLRSTNSKKTEPWTPKVALRPSGVLVVSRFVNNMDVLEAKTLTIYSRDLIRRLTFFIVSNHEVFTMLFLCRVWGVIFDMSTKSVL